MDNIPPIPADFVVHAKLMTRWMVAGGPTTTRQPLAWPAQTLATVCPSRQSIKIIILSRMTVLCAVLIADPDDFLLRKFFYTYLAP